MNAREYLYRKAAPIAREVLAETIGELKSGMVAQERTIADLELRLQQGGWRQLADSGVTAFSRASVAEVVKASRGFALKNVLIARGVGLRARYVFGAGVDITVGKPDSKEQEALDAFLSAEPNKCITGRSGQLLAQIERDVTGNLFIALHAQDRDGRAIDPPQVRTIPFEEIEAIVHDPDDRDTPWFYQRTRSGGRFDATQAGGVTDSAEQVVEWHPSLAYLSTKPDKIPTIGGKPVVWSTPVLHVKGGLGYPGAPWGIPKTYPALDWAYSHTVYLSNFAAVAAALARFAAMLTMKGASAQQVELGRRKLDTTLDTGTTETNPMPAAGSVFVANDQVKLEPFRAAGANVSVDDAKAFRLQVAAALDLPDHILIGDVDQGNLATGRTLDRPTELAMMAEQAAWSDILRTVAGWAIAQKRGGGAQVIDPAEVAVDWPPMMQPNRGEAVDALVKAVAPDSISPTLGSAEKEIRELLLSRAGVQDIDAILDAAFDADGTPKSGASLDDVPRTPREARILDMVNQIRGRLEAA